MLFRTSASVIALVACTSFAAAADLGGPSYGGSLKDDFVAHASHSWSGFYVGLNGGYAWGNFNIGSVASDDPEDENVPPASKISTDGWLGGGQIGFNVQSGRFVFGLEADWQASDMDGSKGGTFEENYQPYIDEGFKEFSLESSTEISSFGTVRGRLGIAIDHVVPYITGGFAWAKAKNSIVYTGGGAEALGEEFLKDSDSKTHTGWVIGGGVEIALTDNLSAKAEYLYVDLGKEKYQHQLVNTPEIQGPVYTTSADIDFHTFRVGVNYKFGN